MEGFQISFKVFANSQEEADKASTAFKNFVNDKARQGMAVTANKLVEVLNKYGNNMFVNSYLRKK